MKKSLIISIIASIAFSSCHMKHECDYDDDKYEGFEKELKWEKDKDWSKETKPTASYSEDDYLGKEENTEGLVVAGCYSDTEDDYNSIDKDEKDWDDNYEYDKGDHDKKYWWKKKDHCDDDWVKPSKKN